MGPPAVSSTGAARLQRGNSLGFGETPDRVTFNPAQAPLADREVLRCASHLSCCALRACMLKHACRALMLGGVSERMSLACTRIFPATLGAVGLSATRALVAAQWQEHAVDRRAVADACLLDSAWALLCACGSALVELQLGSAGEGPEAAGAALQALTYYNRPARVAYLRELVQALLEGKHEARRPLRTSCIGCYTSSFVLHREKAPGHLMEGVMASQRACEPVGVCLPCCELPHSLRSAVFVSPANTATYQLNKSCLHAGTGVARHCRAQLGLEGAVPCCKVVSSHSAGC